MTLFKIIGYSAICGGLFFSTLSSQDRREYQQTIDPKKYGWQEELETADDMQAAAYLDYIALERMVDSETYILGPGDIIGINIISSESMNYSLRILPSGSILIPSVGSLNLNGENLKNAVKKIKSYIKKNAYPNARVFASLEHIKRFKVQISGAIHEPGFIEVNGVSRLMDAVALAGGVHKYAESNLIILSRRDSKVNYHPGKFLMQGDVGQNPYLQEGDVIHIPFDKLYEKDISQYSDLNYSQVVVIGFVQVPGGFRYIPGYKVRDYIAIRGGPTDSGSLTGARIIRKDGTVITNALDKGVFPGDIIEVPATLQYRLFGRTSATQIISAFLSIYLAYQASIN
ncbi:MAG: SLBB domain-containing protein [Candidatus Marinimicrobia bacterium]|jgi:polysaccharide export outer membrane protein|nr:SLBB domain-containing protein [Candidatus Neomarinimicrobiota bacterium]